jgi:hypothetical protein
VPSRNGSVTDAPGARHSTQAGATLGAAPGGAGDDDVPELVPVVPGVEVGADLPPGSGAVVVCAAAGPASAIRSGNATRNGWAMAPVDACFSQRYGALRTAGIPGRGSVQASALPAPPALLRVA